ncbi:MAG: FAD-dependent oxidoreductase [Planctomycetes bacterium]|nr:FAD-dependent oxidoreductase [Planctomycetota bacterium]
MEMQYDALVIGAGPGGNAAAEQVGRRGGRACLVESHRLGGLETDKGVIPVDDHCRTGVDSIYAVGDVAEMRQHSHLAETIHAHPGFAEALRGIAEDWRNDRIKQRRTT